MLTGAEAYSGGPSCPGGHGKIFIGNLVVVYYFTIPFYRVMSTTESSIDLLTLQPQNMPKATMVPPVCMERTAVSTL